MRFLHLDGSVSTVTETAHDEYGTNYSVHIRDEWIGSVYVANYAPGIWHVHQTASWTDRLTGEAFGEGERDTLIAEAVGNIVQSEATDRIVRDEESGCKILESI
jgi:hypothetical protein